MRSIAWIVLVLAFAAPGVRAENPGNGIVVSGPSQYPYRFLEERLAELDAQLAQIRAINAVRLAEQLGQVQGRRSRSTELSLTGTELPLPRVETVREAGDDGALATTTETTTRDAFTPAAPGLTSTLPEADPTTVSPSAGDLLEEQVRLQSQADSIRTILRRALSDRYREENGVSGARRIALVGFRVTLDPKRWHKNAAAVVEIEVEHADGTKATPSLVAQIPEEKTYNATAVSRRINAFSGAAFAGVFSVGAGGRRQSQNIFAYQDADTFAFERPLSADSKSRTFGWQFRPVLGNPSVDPGTRYLFAVLALDAFDGAGEADVNLRITARSYWLDYKPNHRLARARAREPRFLFEGLEFPVLSSTDFQEGLAPRVESVTASSIGGGVVLVQVVGSNLFVGSTVHLGNRRVDGVVHRTDERLEFVVPMSQVLADEVRITGAEFGFSTLVHGSEPADSGGFMVSHIHLSGFGQGDYRIVEVALKNPEEPAAPPDLRGRDVFMTFGSDLYEIPFERWRPSASGQDRTLVASVEVPTRLLRSDQLVIVKVPFLGKSYEAGFRYHPPMGASRVIILQAGNPTVWGILGYGLDQAPDLLRVYAGKEYRIGNGLVVERPDLLTLSAPGTALANAKEIVVMHPGLVEPITLRAPSVPPEKPKPTVTNKPTVAQNQAPAVEFVGTGLKQVEKVVFEGKDIPFNAASNEKLVVYVSRDVTKQAGTATLLGQTAGGGLLPLELTVTVR